MVLAFLMRLKQICNHPSQWLGDGAWAEEDSGKFARLREIAEVIAARQEKALVFTQFKETTAPLAAFLGSVFGQAGPRPPWRDRGEEAQGTRAPFSGGRERPVLRALAQGWRRRAQSYRGLARHPFRPVVESGGGEPGHRPRLPHRADQRTCSCTSSSAAGTVEDKIDQMIESKKQLAGDLLEGGADMQLTEMKDEELLKLVALDLGAAMKEG